MSERTDSIDLDFEDVREILDEYFSTGDLESALGEVPAERVFARVSESERARRYFNELALADRALVEGSQGLDELFDRTGEFERGFGEAMFDHKLDDMLEAERTGSRESEPEADGGSRQAEPGGEDEATVVSLFGGSQGVAATLAAAALAVLVFGVVMSRRAENTDANGGDDFRARSAATPDKRSQFERPSLELFCAQRAKGDVSFEGTTDVPMGSLECPLDAELKLGYRNHSPKLKYAAFFGVDRDGGIYWYGPSPASPEPMGVETTRKVTPFGETIRLDVNHSEGPVRVHAVFSPKPLDQDQLEAVLGSRGNRQLWTSKQIDFEALTAVSTSEVFTIVDEKSREGHP